MQIKVHLYFIYQRKKWRFSLGRLHLKLHLNWDSTKSKPTTSVPIDLLPLWSPQLQCNCDFTNTHTYVQVLNHLVGLVAKASASRAEHRLFEFCLQRDFSESSHTSDLRIGTPVATLPGTWRYRVSAGTGRPSVSILWLGEVESWICNFYLSVAARKIVWAGQSLRCTKHAASPELRFNWSTQGTQLHLNWDLTDQYKARSFIWTEI